MEVVAEIATVLHILAAAFWVGSLIFLCLVFTPVMELVRPPSFQRQLLRRFWQAGHNWMWGAAVTLFATGLFAMQQAGRLNSGLLSASFWTSTAGIKIGLVLLMVALSLVHDLFLGPGARRKDPRDSTDPPGVIGRGIPWLLAAAGCTAFVLASRL